jgi:hypothetical protein
VSAGDVVGFLVRCGSHSIVSISFNFALVEDLGLLIFAFSFVVVVVGVLL